MTVAYHKQPVRQIPDDYRDRNALPLIRNFAIEVDKTLQAIQGDLNGLTSDSTVITIASLPDEANYFRLGGRSGGQIGYGSQDSAGNLALRSTTHATKGKVIFGAAGTSAYDEANERLGVGTAAPSVTLQVAGTGRFDTALSVGGALTAGLEMDVTGDFRATGRIAFTPLAVTLSTNPLAWTAPTTTWLRVSSNAGGRQISGIDATGAFDGQFFGVIDVGTNPFTFVSQAAGASATNRILTNTGANILTAQNKLYWFLRDATTDRWRVWSFITSGTEIINGPWTFNGNATWDIAANAFVILSGSASSAAPMLKFFDTDTSRTVTITCNSFPSDYDFLLPTSTGASDALVSAVASQTLSGKTMALDTVLLASNATSGATHQDTTTPTKNLRHILSGAVGNNSLTVANTAARNYTLGDVPGLAQMVGNGADPPAAGAIGKVDQTGKTGNIANTNLTDTTPAGLYLIWAIVEITTAGTNSLQVRLDYTDSVGAVTNEVMGTQAMTGTGRGIFAWMVHLASGNIVYDTNATGAYGGAVYNLRMRCAFLGT